MSLPQEETVYINPVGCIWILEYELKNFSKHYEVVFYNKSKMYEFIGTLPINCWYTWTQYTNAVLTIEYNKPKKGEL